MCGIAGIWNRDGMPVEANRLEMMTDALAHRGPDGEATKLLGELGLGHRRLSIIDLSPAADQPMSLPDGSLWISYNGEVHNYIELRTELRGRGVAFETETDTEVVLWAYRVWGEACFERFNGMWALALWDARARRLVLSRDRFGIKPLYYSVAGSRVVFASEIKAILAAFPAEAKVHWQTAYELMAGGWPHAGTTTFFENIENVPPAHNLAFELKRQSQNRYWRFEPGTIQDESRPGERLLELLDDAVRLRLRSDVPVGVCLSGGLDSSTVARLMGNRLSSPLECYSLQYEDPRIDESRYASLVADDPEGYRLNWVHPRTDQFISTVEKIVWHYDSPSALRGKYPKWYVMEAAGKRSRVLLEGHGADELLGGYGHFLLPYLVDMFLLRRENGSPGGLTSWRHAASDIASVHGSLSRILIRSCKSLLKQRLAPAGWPWRSLLSRETRSRFPPPSALRTRSAWFFSGSSRPFRSRLDSALWFEVATAGLPESLQAVDATSMAFGIESRPPFLDHRLVEYCFSLPFHQKLKQGWTKWPLREAGLDLLPEEVVWRRKKKGYPGAYADWMTESHTLPVFRDIAVEGPASSLGFLDQARLRRVGSSLDRFASFVRQGPERAWRLLTFQLWYRRFIENAGVRT